MAPHRHGLRRQLRALQRSRRQGRPEAIVMQQLAAQIEHSIQRRKARTANLPAIQFDKRLPIVAWQEEITAAIRKHPVVIVCGDTGSGKSTQLPKICLAMGRGVDGLIGHTQPRRLAARTIAARLADELHSPLGQHVGYKIRFTDTTRPESYIKLMTDGILLAETASDRFLNQYDTIILDEAHERSLNIDFLLGYLTRLLPKRPELRCIITSATIDPERFAEHFFRITPEVPIIEVTGRSYPVEVRYRPVESVADQPDADLPGQIVAALSELLSESSGDTLVFLPTERDIRETAKVLHAWIRAESHELDVLPLYARLPVKEQGRVFAPHRKRRVVLATNVAESSLTVPGIRSVIDTGTARISRYSSRSKVQRLPIEGVSRASADQRKGRCGRTAPGICIRLYSEEDYLTRDQYTTPEIRRTNLAAVILQTLALRLGPIEEFPFVDAPRPEAIRDGYKTLFELGAIDRNQSLNKLGHQLSRFPVDPRIGRMILAADELNCLDDVLIIASALEVRDPRERPIDKQQAADEQHAKFTDATSDFLSYLNLWDFYHHLKETLSRNQLRRACRQHFLSYNRLREWADIYRQLRRLIQERDHNLPPRSNDPNSIHRALLTGLLSGVAYRDNTYQYTGAGGTTFYLWPGSAVFQSRPKWVMASELIETTQRYGRTVARIQPEWIEPIARHLVKTSYSDPYWDQRRSAALVWQRVSLFGLPIVPRRRVPLGPVDPSTARQLFIQHGLVQGELKEVLGFIRTNNQVLEAIEQLAARERRTDWVIGQHVVYEFYDARLPADVFDVPRLRRWLRKTRHRNSSILEMRQQDLLDTVDPDPASDRFPNSMPVGRTRFPLEYRFEPGNNQDGVTITIPPQAINQLTSAQLDWLVAGRLEEKITALIRSLPKSIRRSLVPAPDSARKAIERLTFGQGPFLPTLAGVLEELSGETIPVEAFQLDRLPPHLVMTIHVVDEQGQTLAIDSNLDRLRRELGKQQSDEEIGQIDDAAWNQAGVTRWDFDDLPEEVTLKRGDLVVPAYPALLVQPDGSVALRLMDRPDRANLETRLGVRRLYHLATHRDVREHVAWLPKLNETKLLASTLPDAASLEKELEALIIDRAFVGDNALPRNKRQFDDRLGSAAERLSVAVQQVSQLIHPMMTSYHQAKLAWEQLPTGRLQPVSEDIEQQLNHLVPRHFLLSTPWEWLQHFSRYFQAIDYRLDKLRHGGGARDRQSQQALKPWLEVYHDRVLSHQERGLVDHELVLFRWMLEEFRVSLFAQPLGTALPVSSKRLAKQWSRVPH